KEVLSKIPETGDSPPILPVGRNMTRRTGVIRATPVSTAKAEQVRTGAGIRNTAKPMDGTLRQTRFLGNRPPPAVKQPTQAPAPRGTDPARTPRTGAVSRPVERKSEPRTPIYSPPIVTRPSTPVTPKSPEQKPSAPVTT